MKRFLFALAALMIAAPAFAAVAAARCVTRAIWRMRRHRGLALVAGLWVAAMAPAFADMNAPTMMPRTDKEMLNEWQEINRKLEMATMRSLIGYELVVSDGNHVTASLGVGGCISGPFKAFRTNGDIILDIPAGQSKPANCVSSAPIIDWRIPPVIGVPNKTDIVEAPK